MAVKAMEMAGALIFYHLTHVEPGQFLPAGVRASIRDGFIWSRGGFSVEKDQAREMLEKGVVHEGVLPQEVRIARTDRQEVLALLQRWLDGQPLE